MNAVGPRLFTLGRCVRLALRLFSFLPNGDGPKLIRGETHNQKADNRRHEILCERRVEPTTMPVTKVVWTVKGAMPVKVDVWIPMATASAVTLQYGLPETPNCSTLTAARQPASRIKVIEATLRKRLLEAISIRARARTDAVKKAVTITPPEKHASNCGSLDHFRAGP
jgi:hypothetical protein